MVLVDYHEDDAFDGIQMRRLQLVDTEASLLERSIMMMKSLNLIWICLNKHPNSSLPSGILMKNLKLLQVSRSATEIFWQDESQVNRNSLFTRKQKFIVLKFVCLVHIKISICKYIAYGTCKHFVGILEAIHKEISCLMVVKPEAKQDRKSWVFSYKDL